MKATNSFVFHLNLLIVENGGRVASCFIYQGKFKSAGLKIQNWWEVISYVLTHMRLLHFILYKGIRFIFDHSGISGRITYIFDIFGQAPIDILTNRFNYPNHY